HAAFAEPKSRHHEAIAEAELDIDYKDSPIVIGDGHEALAPGQRLPDTIEVQLPGGEARRLHELAHRAGHTALIIGGPAAAGERLARLDNALQARGGASVIEATVMLTTRSGDPAPCARLGSEAAGQLGIGEIVLLVIRPDGHVGLRADRDHVGA